MLRLFASAALMLTVASGAVAAPREEGEKASDSADKIICKRFTETGSLAKSYRTCKPKSEWERGRDNVRASANSGGCGSLGTPGSCGGN